jgi:hypothetical protein
VRRVSLMLVIAMVPFAALAAPNAETAKRCLRAAYLLYPYKRPGAAPMTGGRLFYFRECMARQQDAASPESEK